MPNKILKPCPYCGDTAWVQFDDTACYHGSSGDYFVQCTNCKSAGQRTKTEEEAIAAWNRRRRHWLPGVIFG